MGETELFTALNLVFANTGSFVRVLAITHGAGGLRDFVGAGVFTAPHQGACLGLDRAVLDDPEAMPNPPRETRVG
ncbi:MAG: hypothetical protein LN413_01520 [Candidatus Thermoplasmatota archaeon]|nr:hypothetical protein [Candidatus Thermoplasmatota archaeon]